MPEIVEGSTNEGDSPSEPLSPATPPTVSFDPNLHVEKSEFTKLRQKDADAQRALEDRVRDREASLSAREQQILQAARLLQQQAQRGQQPDPYAKLRDLPYVDGASLVELVEQVKSQDIGGIVQAIQQRDQALQLMHNQLTKLQKAFDGVQGKSAETEFGGRLSKVRESLGLPDADWTGEFLKDIYLSHEGDDLANEFPNLARTRLDTLRKAFREMDKAEATKARASVIPGQGGNATPGKPLRHLYKSADQIADEAWPTLQDKGE